MSAALRRSRGPRALSADDSAVWSHFARQIALLPGRTAPPAPAEAPAPIISPRLSTPHVPPPRPITSAVAIGHQPGGVDNATWQRFRTGKLPASRTLDLHGRTAQRAFHALVAFIRTAHADHQRCVEVITGRGNGETGGILRRELPLWLNLPDLRPLILAASHPHAANPGSVRLLLRRIR
jgi:DNA-nicking Smr family endonuclease